MDTDKDKTMSNAAKNMLTAPKIYKHPVGFLYEKKLPSKLRRIDCLGSILAFHDTLSEDAEFLPQIVYMRPNTDTDRIIELEKTYPSRKVDNFIPAIIAYSWRLAEYEHALPDQLEYIGADIDLEKYKFALPGTLAGIGGDVMIIGYDHPLPAGLNYIGGNLWMADYAFPLPAGLRVAGEIYR